MYCELCAAIGGYCGQCDGSHWSPDAPHWGVMPAARSADSGAERADDVDAEKSAETESERS